MPGPPVDELVQQRSMLVILMAACQTAQNAFRAAANPLDRELLEDLSTMIVRSQKELERLAAEIERRAASA